MILSYISNLLCQRNNKMGHLYARSSGRMRTTKRIRSPEGFQLEIFRCYSYEHCFTIGSSQQSNSAASVGHPDRSSAPPRLNRQEQWNDLCQVNTSVRSFVIISRVKLCGPHPVMNIRLVLLRPIVRPNSCFFQPPASCLPAMQILGPCTIHLSTKGIDCQSVSLTGRHPVSHLYDSSYRNKTILPFFAPFPNHRDITEIVDLPYGCFIIPFKNFRLVFIDRVLKWRYDRWWATVFDSTVQVNVHHR